ncbi:hypothetical protein ACFXK0_20085 [Nocardia sp. NPDC059177]|uniref:hypothetical protein n=1 Tax=Nocardia sp. NPDC059177 TaxID=3346759 RepID=UPI0036B8B002
MSLNAQTYVFTAERYAWLQSISLNPQAVRNSGNISQQRTYDYFGMTPASAARKIQRLDTVRALETGNSASRELVEIASIDPGIVTPSDEFPGDNMPEVPDSNIPPGYHHEPTKPNEDGNMTLPYNIVPDQPPGGPDGGSDDPGRGPGNSSPRNGADVGPEGMQPGTETGEPRIQYDDEGDWDERYPHGDPEQVPSEHTLPDPTLPDYPEHQQAQQNNPETTSPYDDLNRQVAPSTTPPGSVSPGYSDMVPEVEAPETTQDPAADPAPETERSIGEPGFLESLIPVWGSARQAINDFQNGRWVWGTINALLAISDLFLIKSLGTAAAKIFLKLGKPLLAEVGALGNRVKSAFDDLLDFLPWRKPKKQPPKLQDPAFEHGALGDDFAPGVHDPSSAMDLNERAAAELLEDMGWRVDARPTDNGLSGKKNPDFMVRKSPEEWLVNDRAVLSAGPRWSGRRRRRRPRV